MKSLIFAVLVYAAFPLMVILPVEGYAATTETRELDSFDSIKVGGAVELMIQFSEETRVQVTAPDGDLEKVKTNVSGDTLVINTRGDLFDHGHYRVDVTLPLLERLDASGATEVRIVSFTGNGLDLEVDGASSVDFDEVDLGYLYIDTSGAADIDFKSLKVEELTIDASGAASIDLGVVQVGAAKIDGSGASDIDAEGTMRTLRVDMSGASSFVARDLQVDNLTTDVSFASRIRVGH